MKAGKTTASLAVLGALALPAVAEAKTVTYGGTASGGAAVAIDVKVSGKGFLKKVVALRGEQIPVTCDQSGGPQPAGTNIPVGIKINSRGRFSFAATDPTYGFRRAIDGKFNKTGRKITGTFVFGDHFPATATLPEENCQSKELKFSVKLGGPDVDGEPGV